MANSKSAAKRVRQTKSRTVRNKADRTRIKNARKAVLTALESGDVSTAQERYNQFASAADKAAKRNVIHRNAAARLKSNLAKSVRFRLAGS